MLQDSKERYGTLTRFFHWLIAVFVLNQFFKFFDPINDGEHWLKETFGPYHTSIGALIFILAIVRLIWAVKQKAQRPDANASLDKLARLAHGVMYFCMIVMPPLGVLYIWGKGYPVKLFGQVFIDKPAGETAWAITLGGLHSPLAWLLLLLVLGHIGAAIYHHRVLKDDTLKRML